MVVTNNSRFCLTLFICLLVGCTALWISCIKRTKQIKVRNKMFHQWPQSWSITGTVQKASAATHSVLSTAFLWFMKWNWLLLWLMLLQHTRKQNHKNEPTALILQQIKCISFHNFRRFKTFLSVIIALPFLKNCRDPVCCKILVRPVHSIEDTDLLSCLCFKQYIIYNSHAE